MENKLIHREHEPLTPESLPRILQEIAKWREEKGQSEKVIPYIREIRRTVESWGNQTAALQLHQEEYLAGHHMIMEERDKGRGGKPLRIARGFLTTWSAVRKMEDFLTDDTPASIHLKRIPRFQGRFADMTRQYDKAEKFYNQALREIETEQDPASHANVLEIKGFIAEAVFKQGRPEGWSQVKQAIKAFDESPEGKWLKENNYYAWAVWKSGIEIRTADLLLKQKNPAEAKRLIALAETELIMPDGNTKVFGIRQSELDAVRQKLYRLLTQ